MTLTIIIRGPVQVLLDWQLRQNLKRNLLCYEISRQTKSPLPKPKKQKGKGQFNFFLFLFFYFTTYLPLLCCRSLFSFDFSFLVFFIILAHSEFTACRRSSPLETKNEIIKVSYNFVSFFIYFFFTYLSFQQFESWEYYDLPENKHRRELFNRAMVAANGFTGDGVFLGTHLE